MSIIDDINKKNCADSLNRGETSYRHEQSTTSGVDTKDLNINNLTNSIFNQSQDTGIIPENADKKEHKQNSNEENDKGGNNEQINAIEFDLNHINENTQASLMTLVSKLFSIAFPTALFFLLMVIHELISTIFINKKYEDTEMIDALGISAFYINCTYYAVFYGISASVETLCSNAFTCKRYKLCRIYIGRAQIVGSIVVLVLYIIHFFTIHKAMDFFANNKRISELAYRNVHMMLLVGLFDNFAAINVRYFFVINKPSYNFIFFLILTPFHILFCYIFISILDLDTLGAGISYLCTRTVGFIISVVLVACFNPCPQAYSFFGRASFGLKGLKNYFVFALGPMFLLIAEWWAGELLNIIALQIDKFEKNAFTVHCIVSQLLSNLYCVNFGINTACSILVSKALPKNIDLTKNIVKASLVLGFILILFVIIVLVFLRYPLLGLFIANNDEEMSLAVKCLMLCALSESFDMIQTVFSATFRGSGLALRASIISFFSFYIVMTSLSWVLGYSLEIGILGLWISIATGYCFSFLAYSVMLLCVDLKKQQQEALKRLEDENEEHIIEELLKNEDQGLLSGDENNVKEIEKENSI